MDLLDKDFIPPISNMLKEVKEIMSKELKENMRMIFHQIKNTNKGTNHKQEANGYFRVEK